MSPSDPSSPLPASSTTPLPAIGFIGGGNMASAMIRALLRLAPPPALAVSDPDPAKRAAFTAQGLNTHADNGMITAASRVVILAIKPQMAASVVPQIGAAWGPDTLLISILAGMPLTRLSAWLPPGAKVVRAMPNTPLAIGEGMTGLCPGAHAGPDDLALAESIFATCGKVLRIADEARMDAITAVSGSGPAYVFAVAEALLAGAQALGFTPDEAQLLVAQTMHGSLDYLLQSGFDAQRLRQQVTSPGGTTAAALAVLERRGHQAMWVEALQAAHARGRELGAG